jgi:hypothetical protein
MVVNYLALLATGLWLSWRHVGTGLRPHPEPSRFRAVWPPDSLRHGQALDPSQHRPRRGRLPFPCFAHCCARTRNPMKVIDGRVDCGGQHRRLGRHRRGATADRPGRPLPALQPAEHQHLPRVQPERDGRQPAAKTRGVTLQAGALPALACTGSVASRLQGISDPCRLAAVFS